MTSDGWVKLWRRLERSDVWELSPLGRCVFIWLLMHANHEDRLWNGATVGAGELITSYSHIARGVSWKEQRAVKTPAMMQIRWCIKRLEAQQVIQHEARQGGLWVKVLHWEQYQGGMNGTITDSADGGTEEPQQDSNNKQEDKKEEENISSNMSKIFTHWQKVMDKPKSKLTPDRRAKINSRLREGYSTEDIMAAIDGCRASAWHMGENPRGALYNDFDLICRNGSKLEQFMAAKDGNKTALQVLRERWSR